MEEMQLSVKNLFFKNQFVLVAAIVILIWFLIQIQEILILFFISYILMAALKPYVRFLTRFKIPRVIAIAIVYLAALLAIILLIVPLIPFFSAQIMSLITSFPSYLGGILHTLRLNIGSAQVQTFLTNQMDTIGANAFAFTGAILGSVFSLVLVFVVSFYLMLDEERVTRELASLFPKPARLRVLDVVSQVEEKLGAWFIGQIILCFCIGLAVWLSLVIIGFPFALPLALLAGMLEIVPALGPILSAIPAVIVALSVSPGLVLLIILIYVVIHTLEGNILVPKVMQRAVGLNPIVIILAISIGAKLLGIMGALLSIPFVSMIIIIGKNLRKE